MSGDSLDLSPVSILGEILADELDARGWTRQEFAGRLGMAHPAIRDVVEGRVHIGPHMAKQLGNVLGTSAELWERLDQVPNSAVHGDDEPPASTPASGGAG